VESQGQLSREGLDLGVAVKGCKVRGYDSVCRMCSGGACRTGPPMIFGMGFAKRGDRWKRFARSEREENEGDGSKTVTT